jgi:hypothetical protein
MPELQTRLHCGRIPDSPLCLVAHKFMQTLCLFSLLVFLTPVQGQTIYKIIDAEGNITYSSAKPDDASNAEVINAPREPSQEEINAALQRQAELEQSLQQLQARKKTKEIKRTKQRKKADKTLQQTIDNNSAIPGLLF